MKTNTVENKCVLVIDSELPIGLIANTAAILGITLGHKFGHIVGEDVSDASNQSHLGITNIPIPILKGTKDNMKELIGEIKANYGNELITVDFSNVAQSCTDYQNYTFRVNRIPSDMFEYLGIGIYGSSKKLNKLTGNMPLLR